MQRITTSHDPHHQQPELTPYGGTTMPVFDTPEPISVTIDLGLGDIRIAASDRADTVVDVRPTDESNEPDVRAAEQTRVEYTAGRCWSWGRSSAASACSASPGRSM